MDKTQFIKDLQPKMDVDSIFLVKYIARMEGKDGKSYLNIILCDNSGDIEARKWAGAEKLIQTVEKGCYVRVAGKVNLYQGRLQLVLSDINPVDATTICVDHFVAQSSHDPHEMLGQLVSMIEKLDDVYIRDLLLAILHDAEISRRMKIWAAGKTIHHAYQGGLLEHLLQCVRLADILSAIYPVNRNFVVAGAMLHDLCKVYELTDGTMVDYTEEGRLVGHLINAVELLDRFCSKIKDFPSITKLHLKHILVSHHGEYEFGSPKLPQTSEALLVHYIDLIDSKMNSFEAAKQADRQVGHWTTFVKHLDRMVYKAELPTHKEYLKENPDTSEKEVIKTAKKNDDAVAPGKQTLELKHNMSAMLKNIKLDD